MGAVKTTVEIPDELFRRAKAVAAEQGSSLKQLITQALTEKLMRRTQSDSPTWTRAFGAMKGLKRENRRIEQLIEEEFERVEPEDRS